MTEHDNDRPRRSALYLPASNERAIEKARTLAADIIILDLEDAVAPEQKDQARNNAVEAAGTGGYGSREIAIRINALDTPWGTADMAAAIQSGADAILVPKVASPHDVRMLDRAMQDAPAGMALWVMVETCAAVLALDQIAALADETRLSLFVLGTNDLAKEMRARLTPDRTAFLPILTQSVLAARAHGLIVLDGVCNEFRELDLFEAEAEQGMLFGFDGKTLIHPAQIEPCNAVFSPSEAELKRARAIIEAFSLPQNAGKGVISVDGEMAELLHLEQAERVVVIANRIASAD